MLTKETVKLCSKLAPSGKGVACGQECLKNEKRHIFKGRDCTLVRRLSAMMAFKSFYHPPLLVELLIIMGQNFLKYPFMHQSKSFSQPTNNTCPDSQEYGLHQI